MPEQVFVVGHKNPDTDSICSAIAYADFCQKQGRSNVVPARAGSLNRQADRVCPGVSGARNSQAFDGYFPSLA